MLQNKDTVILLHGFFRTKSDMFSLKEHLERYGYVVVAVTLPTWFGSLEKCERVFAAEFPKLIANHDEAGKIHLVGHSMGGLIIRQFLASQVVPKLGRCVFVATPNAGSKLADLARLFFPPSPAIFQPLKCLVTDRPEIKPPLNNPLPEIGIIAGSRITFLLGRLLPRPNDGRVEVDAAKLEGMQDFTVLDYHHLEIHHKPDIAELVHQFLQLGEFTLNK